MTCRRCGATTPRLTVDQRYCPQCSRDVARIVELDAARRDRFPHARIAVFRPAA